MATTFDLANQPQPQDLSAPRTVNKWLEEKFGLVGEPLGQAAEAITTPIAGLFVSPESAQRFGQGFGSFARGLPRMATDIALSTAKHHPLLRPLGFGDVALQAFSGTPPEASLPAKAAATAVQTGAFFKAPQIGGRLAGIGQDVTPSLYQRAGRAVGTLGAMKVGESAAAGITGQDWTQPWQPTPENIGGSLAAVVPWEVGGAWHDYLKSKELQKKQEVTVARDTVPELKAMAVPDEEGSQLPVKSGGLGMEPTGKAPPKVTDFRRPDDITLRPRSFGKLNLDKLFRLFEGTTKLVGTELGKKREGSESFAQGNVGTFAWRQSSIINRLLGQGWQRQLLADPELAKMPPAARKAEMERQMDALSKSISESTVDKFYAPDLRLLFSEAQKMFADDLKRVADKMDDPKVIDALHDLHSVFHEIRARLFERGLAQGENVVDATLPELVRYKETLEGKLDEMYGKGKYGIAGIGQLDRVLNGLLNKVNGVIAETPGGPEMLEQRKAEMAKYRDLSEDELRKTLTEPKPLSGDYDIDFHRTAYEAAKVGGNLAKLPREHMAFVEKLDKRENDRWWKFINTIKVRDWAIPPLEKGETKPPTSAPKFGETGVTIQHRKDLFEFEKNRLADKYAKLVAPNRGMVGEGVVSELQQLFKRIKSEVNAWLDNEIGRAPTQDSPSGEYSKYVRDRSWQLRTAVGKAFFDVTDPVGSVDKLVDSIKGSRPTPGEVKATTVAEKEPQLDQVLKDALDELTARLVDVDPKVANERLVAAAQKLLKISQSGRKPGEKLYQWLARTLHIDPRTEEPNGPHTLLETWQQAFRSWHDLMGTNPDEAARMEPWALQLAATVGKGLGETRVLPAVSTPTGTDRIVTAFAQPSRGLTTDKSNFISNAIIGLFPRAEQIGDLARFIHSFVHETFHLHVAQSKFQTFVPGDATARTQLITAKKTAIDNMFRIAGEMTPEEMRTSMRTLMDNIGAKMYSEHMKNREFDWDPKNPEEFLSDLFGVYAIAAVSPQRTKLHGVLHDMFKFGSGDFESYLAGIIHDIAELFSSVKVLAQIFQWAPKNVDRLTQITKNMDSLFATRREAQNAVTAFLAMTGTKDAKPWVPIAPIDIKKMNALARAYWNEPVDAKFMELIEEASPWVVPQKGREVFVGEQRLKPWDFFISGAEIHRYHPELRPMIHLGCDYGNKTREFLSNIHQIYRDGLNLQAPTTLLGRAKELFLGDKVTNNFTRLAKEGPAVNAVFNKLLLIQNVYAENNRGQLLPTEEVRKVPGFNALTPEDQQLVIEMNTLRGPASVFAAHGSYRSYRAQLGTKIAKGLMSHDLSLRGPDDADRIGQALAGLYLDREVQTLAPQVAMDNGWGNIVEMQRIVDEYAAKGPQQAKAVMKMSEGLDDPKIAQTFEAYRKQLLGDFRQKDDGTFAFDTKPGWSPEVRLGRWIIAHQVKGGEPQFNSYRAKADYDRVLAGLRAQEAKGELRFLINADKTDTNDVYAGMDPDKFGKYSDAVTAMTNHVLARMGNEHPELSEEIRRELQDELKPDRAMLAVLESPYMKERRFIGGRENLNMAEGLLHYYNNLGYTIGKRHELGRQQLYLKDPEMRANPNYQKWARKYFEEINRPTDQNFKWLKRAIAFNYVFFSPSLAFIELTQQGTNHIPALLMQGMGFGEALNATRKANLDVVNAYRKGHEKRLGYDVYEDRPGEVVDPKTGMNELTRVMKLAHDRNLAGAGVGWNQEFWELAHDASFINARNLFGGSGAILDRTGLVGKPLYQMYKLGANMHGIAIAQNTKVAFKTAYEHFRGPDPLHPKMSEEEAFRQAEDLSRESMHGGGKATRPLWFLGIGPGSPGAGVGSIMFSLQMYVYSTVAQMANYLQQAIKNTCKNPMEITAAHKAAATMLGTQLVLAGVAGIPITMQMIALVEQMCPDKEPRRRLREYFFGLGKKLNEQTGLLDDDDKMGQFIQTAATDGLMSVFAPWNLSNRFELGVIMGVDPYRGFDWKNVVGPGGPLLEQIILKPAQLAAKGGSWQEVAATAIPNSNVRRLVDEAVHGWDLRNQDDRLNVQLDQNEKILMALGFTPKRVADFRALDQMKRRAETAHALEQKKFHAGLADRYVAGDQEGVTQQLLQRARETQTYDPREGARRVAELVQQRTIPYDPLRSGSGTSKSYTIGQLFDLYRGEEMHPVSEVDRYLGKEQIASQLGFPGKISRQSLKEAQLVDQVLRMNPTMSRMEALEMLGGVLHPGPTGRLMQYQ